MSKLIKLCYLLPGLLAMSCKNENPAPLVAQEAPRPAQAAAAETTEAKEAPAPAPKPARKPAAVSLAVTNLTANQELNEGEPVLFRIAASSEIRTVKVFSNGRELGLAQPGPNGLRFETNFGEPGDLDLEFTGFGADTSRPIASATYRVLVRRRPAPPSPAPRSRYMNAYVLKAVQHLLDNYAGRGYNRQKAFTHDVAFHNLGVLRPTGGGQTMCVAAMLEVLIKAIDIYAAETGDLSPYRFLPFESWSKLKPGTFRSSLWVNPKEKSDGSGDAFVNFGMGERVKFRDLEPGGFININRTTRTGHAVVFIAFIDKAGKELPRYGEEVVGFKYFSAQGRALKGQGGFGYRYAFFSKHGCPEVPVKRDCNVIFSDKPSLLNVGQLFMPAHWKRVSPVTDALGRVGESERGTEPGAALPAEFDGLTTDD